MGAGLNAGETTLGGRGVEEALWRELGLEFDGPPGVDTIADGPPEEPDADRCCWLPAADGGGLPQLMMPTE